MALNLIWNMTGPKPSIQKYPNLLMFITGKYILNFNVNVANATFLKFIGVTGKHILTFLVLMKQV